MQTSQAVRKPDGLGPATVHLAGDAVGRSALRKASVRLLPLIGLGYGIAYMDRVNVSFAALQMNQQLHFSQTVFGLGAGLFFVTYAALEIPSNLLMVRVGARLWLARIMFTWGLLSMGMTLVRTPHEFYAMRLLLGAAEAGFFPGIMFYLAQWFPARVRSRAISRFYVAFPLSTTVMGGLAGVLLHLGGRVGLAGWQWLLLAEGLPAVLLSAVFLVGLPDGPEKAKWLTEPERAWVLLEIRDEGTKHAHGADEIGQAFRDPRVWMLGIFLLCLYIAGYGYAFMAPSLLQRVTGAGSTMVGLIIAGLGLLGAAAMVGNGWHSDRRQERFRHVLIPLLVLACGYAGAGSSHRAAVVLPSLVVMTLGYYAIHAPLWVIATSFLRGKSAAVGIATVNSIGMLGAFAGPYWMGWMADLTGGYEQGLLTLAVPVLGSAATLVAVHRYSEMRALRAVPLAPVSETVD
jgi:ACS family tartrate transporter-like MFS transporter